MSRYKILKMEKKIEMLKAEYKSIMNKAVKERDNEKSLSLINEANSKLTKANELKTKITLFKRTGRFNGYGDDEEYRILE